MFAFFSFEKTWPCLRVRVVFTDFPRAVLHHAIVGFHSALCALFLFCALSFPCPSLVRFPSLSHNLPHLHSFGATFSTFLFVIVSFIVFLIKHAGAKSLCSCFLRSLVEVLSLLAIVSPVLYFFRFSHHLDPVPVLYSSVSRITLALEPFFGRQSLYARGVYRLGTLRRMYYETVVLTALPILAPSPSFHPCGVWNSLFVTLGEVLAHVCSSSSTYYSSPLFFFAKCLDPLQNPAVRSHYCRMS